VTTAEWLTPEHHPLQGTGLMPDTVTTPVAGKDIDLDTAVDQLKKLVEAAS
jgi:C-terminal processing protease CtpA/Prc